MKHFHWFSTRKFPVKLTAGHHQLEQSALIWRWELGLFLLALCVMGKILHHSTEGQCPRTVVHFQRVSPTGIAWIGWKCTSKPRFQTTAAFLLYQNLLGVSDNWLSKSMYGTCEVFSSIFGEGLVARDNTRDADNACGERQRSSLGPGT